MSGHTPGPWWLHQEYSTVYVEAKARDPRATQEVAAVGPKEGGSEQQAADARLIAAAPELLAVAQAVADNIVLSETSVGLLARAAIAKATQP